MIELIALVIFLVIVVASIAAIIYGIFNSAKAEPSKTIAVYNSRPINVQYSYTFELAVIMAWAAITMYIEIENYKTLSNISMMFNPKYK